MTEQTQQPEAEAPEKTPESEAGKPEQKQEAEKTDVVPREALENVSAALREARREARSVKQEFGQFRETTTRRFQEVAEQLRKSDEPNKDEDPDAWRDWQIEQLNAKVQAPPQEQQSGTNAAESALNPEVMAYIQDDFSVADNIDQLTQNYHKMLVEQFKSDGLNDSEAEQEARAEEIELMEKAHKRGTSMVTRMERDLAKAQKSAASPGAGKEKLMKGKEAEDTTGTVEQPGSGPPPAPEDIDEFLNVKDDAEFHQRWDQYLRSNG